MSSRRGLIWVRGAGLWLGVELGAFDSDGWLQEQDLKKEEVYEVRKITGKRLSDDNVVEYHVEWVHYGDWTTWEPEG